MGAQFFARRPAVHDCRLVIVNRRKCSFKKAPGCARNTDLPSPTKVGPTPSMRSKAAGSSSRRERHDESVRPPTAKVRSLGRCFPVRTRMLRLLGARRHYADSVFTKRNCRPNSKATRQSTSSTARLQNSFRSLAARLQQKANRAPKEKRRRRKVSGLRVNKIERSGRRPGDRYGMPRTYCNRPSGEFYF